MTIHINANLHPVVKGRVGMLHWVMDPEVSGFIIGYNLEGNQVLICNFDVSSRSFSKQLHLSLFSVCFDNSSSD